MERPSNFHETQWLGDKRTQLVYDVDAVEDASVIEDIIAADAGICFGPDSLAEARNRGYRIAKA